MSDYILTPKPETNDTTETSNTTAATQKPAVPEFLSRLRDCWYTSPKGVVSHLYFDDLERSGGKKATVHEITDSDDSVIQDLGSTARVYPMEIYFIGEDYDEKADAFFESLFERYTPDKPGLLTHPRWGDIPVIPFAVTQKEAFVSGVGMARFTVEFRETKSLSYPSSAAQSAGKAAASVDDLQDGAGAVADGIDVSSASAYAQMKATLKTTTKKISDAVDAVSDAISDVKEEVDEIKAELDTAIDALSSPATCIAQIGNLVRTIASVVTDTPAKVAQIADLTQDLIAGYVAEIKALVRNDEKKNAAATLETVGAVCTGALVEAAHNTDLATREGMGAMIDQISATYSAYAEAIDTARDEFSGTINTLYLPNHDLLAGLQALVKEAQSVLIDKSFALKTKRTWKLNAPSDPLTLTWEIYGNIDSETIDFFCKTNRVTRDEFIELSAGREVVAYV